MYTSKMAERSEEERSFHPRAQHFACPDPLSRESVSRTTRYRILKRKRSENSYDETNSTSVLNCHNLDQRRSITDHDQSIILDDYQPADGDHDNYTCQEGIPSYSGIMSEDPLNIYEDVDPLTGLLPDFEHNTEEFSEHYLSDDSEGIEEVNEPVNQLENCDYSEQDLLPSFVLLKQFTLRHHLTQDALSDLLKFLSIYSPKNQWSSSVYLFNKQFQTVQNVPIFHYFCSDCYQSLPSANEKKCPNSYCGGQLDKKGAISSFIELPLQQQFASLLQRKDYLHEIYLKNEKRNAEEVNHYTDICDGSVYKDMIFKGVFSSKHHISVILNTDGVPVFRSSSFSFWPIHLLINELPYRMRITTENRLLGGIWYGNSKPEMSLFLKPVVDSLAKLYLEGFEVTLPNGEQIKCHVSVIACTCDLPARALMMNMIQYNGYYGCSHCKQKGASIATDRQGRIHSFPYNATDPTGPRRIAVEHHKEAIEATNSGSPVHGVKGPSPLEAIPNFPLFNGMSFDYMHLALLGVTRKLLHLWFSKQHHAEMWYLGRVVKDIDILLCSIRPPNEIKRTPRSIESTVKYWKAHELKTWLLHYSPVVLVEYLPEDYYQHHLLLVEGIFLLLKDVVTNHDVIQSKQLLNHYCFLFSALYDDRYMTLNVHGLLHLPEIVTNLGPLWAHSCFPFEAGNGDLLKFFHGSSGVEKQIIEHVNITQTLPLLARTFTAGSKEEQLYNQMSFRKQDQRHTCCQLDINFCLHGKAQSYQLLQEDLDLFHTAEIIVPQCSVMLYKKIHLVSLGRIIKASSKKKTLRDNSGIIFMNNLGLLTYGRLQKVLYFNDTQRVLSCAIIQKFSPGSKYLCEDSLTNAKLNDHIIQMEVPREDDNVLVDISSILDKCIIMDLGNCIYVSHFPNSVETE